MYESIRETKTSDQGVQGATAPGTQSGGSGSRPQRRAAATGSGNGPAPLARYEDPRATALQPSPSLPLLHHPPPAGLPSRGGRGPAVLLRLPAARDRS